MQTEKVKEKLLWLGKYLNHRITVWPFPKAARCVKSTKYLANLVLNKSVEVKSYGTDRYGRTLGVVFVGGKNVNLEIVKAGLAEVYRGRPAGGLNLEPY